MPVQPAIWKPTSTANTITADDQDQVRSVQLANGDIWITWRDFNDTGAGVQSGSDIIGQRFNALGEAQGGPVRLNFSLTVDNERAGALAADVGSSEFYIAYEDFDDPGLFSDIYLERKNADGTHISLLTIADDPTNDSTGINFRDPAIAIATSTSGLVVYERSDSAGDTDIMGQLFDPSSNSLIGVAFEVRSGSDDASDPQVVALTNGNYLVVWTDEFNGTTDLDIQARLYSSAGTSITSFSVAASGLIENDAAIAALPGGGFVISYTRDDDIFAVRYNASGVAQGSVITVASGTDAQNENRVAATSDGGFVVIWENDSQSAIQAQSYDSAGTVVGGVTTVSGLSQGRGSLIALADGRLLYTIDNNEAQFGILDPRAAPNSAGAYTFPNDRQVGTIGNDTFTAADSVSLISGWDGNDTISDGSGTNALISGDAGDDRVIMTGSLSSSENADGGAGIDTLEFINLPNLATTVNLSAGTAIQSGGTTMSATNFENFFVAADTIPAFVVSGTAGDNEITTGAGNDVLVGGEGNDKLSAGAGANELYGGAGQDTYFITTAGDSTIEAFDGGYDTISTALASYVLQANIEVLSYTGVGEFVGVGNTGNNDMISGFGRDQLFGGSGNDTLINRGGADGQEDTLLGGQGNDIYRIALRGDSTIEYLGEGIDTVETTFSVYALQANVENLTYTDVAQHDAGVGNGLDNVLRGNTGADSLFGREGNDTLYGGAGAANTLLGQQGNDIYYVDAAGDSVKEVAGEGIDQVYTTLTSFVLADNVEQVAYVGSGNFVGIGNGQGNVLRGGGLADTLSGLDGEDVLIGWSGADELQGGAGPDQFRYLGGETEFDRIRDFTSGSDKIVLVGSGFAHTANFTFLQGAATPTPGTGNSTFLYNSTTGMLSYDSDGSGAAAAIDLAQLNAGLNLLVSDFLILV